MEQRKVYRPGRRGQVMILGVLLIGTLMAMSAIAFDLGYIYVVKSRLMTSVDAAALAGIRELPEGNAAAETAVRRTFAGNFPNGAMMTKSPRLTKLEIQSTGGAQRLEIVGQTEAPLFFARWFGRDATTIQAGAETVRRARNVIMVLDYSGSVKAALPAIKKAAIDFVGTFDPAVDQLGLATFSDLAALHYAPRKNFVDGMTKTINSIESDEYTNSAGGLYWAYRGLKDLVDPFASKKLNSIVFFTDGRASAFPARALLRQGPGLCSVPEAEGMITLRGAQGLFLRLEAPPLPVRTQGRINRLPRVPGCEEVRGERIVESIKPTWYPEGRYLPGGVSIQRQGSTPVSTRWISDYNARRTARNMVLNIADAIREDQDLNIVINAIGFSAADPVVLNQVANTATSTAYNSSKEEGMYVYADSQEALQEAFRSVASSLGRLVK